MKRIFIILVAACLMVSGLNGYVYAIDHQKVNDSKVISFAPYGTSGDELQEWDAVFGWMNPDCNNAITIKQISIIRADGVVVKETYPNTELQPHQTRILTLSNSDIPAPTKLPNYPETHTVRFYTVEISYSAKGKTLPLVGTVAIFQYSYDDEFDDTPVISKTRTNMINM